MKTAAHKVSGKDTGKKVTGNSGRDDLEPVTARLPAWVVRELETRVSARKETDPGLRFNRSDEVRTILIDHFTPKLHAKE